MVDQILNAASQQEEEPKRYDIFTMAEKWLALHYDLRWNIVANRLECKEKSKGEWQELNEDDLWITMMKQGVKMSQANLLTLLRSTYVKREDPLLEYFQSLPEWDGKTDHIAFLSGHVKVKKSEQSTFATHFKKMLIRMVACALQDGYFNKQCMVLIGQQNDGKTSFLRFLCPPKLNEYYTEDIDLGSKDGDLSLANNFIINLDELSALHKMEVNRLKSMFSKDSVKLRPAYESKPRRFSRRANFMASTNREEFLTDETGNVRWVAFKINGINWDYRKHVDINHVWAQAYALFKQGERGVLTVEEIRENEMRNQGFMVETPEMQLVAKHYIVSDKDNPLATFLSSAEIVEELVRKSGSGNKINSVNVGRALAALGHKRVSLRSDGQSPRYGYYVITNF